MRAVVCCRVVRSHEEGSKDNIGWIYLMFQLGCDDIYVVTHLSSVHDRNVPLCHQSLFSAMVHVSCILASSVIVIRDSADGVIGSAVGWCAGYSTFISK
jgi:hypothetical protein